jgi:hypothetical protein
MWASTFATAAGLISGPWTTPGFEAVADLQRLHPRRELGDELVMHLVLHEDAVGADAGLAHVAVLGDHRPFDRRIDVGVFEDDEGRIAAELEADALHGGGRLRHQELADRRRAGEADEAHRRMLAPDLADGGRVAGDDVDDAGRDAGAVGELGQGESRQRRLGSGLHHHGAADGDRRRALAGDHRRREVPRRDGGADADRLLLHEDAVVGAVLGDDVAIDAAGFLGEELDEGSGIGDLALGLGQRLALFGRHETGQVLLAFQHEVVPEAQSLATLGGGEGAPGRPGRLRRQDGAPGLRHAHGGHLGDDLAGGGIGHRQGEP